jgi:tetratricopeptide (TPR) repeat protein
LAIVLGLLLLATAVASLPEERLGVIQEVHWSLLGEPPVSLVLLPALVLLTLLAVRWWRLRRHAERPGPIAVQDIRDASGDGVPTEQLSALFRERLSRVGLAPPDSVPSATAPSEALGLLRSAAREKTPLAAALGSLEVVWPRHGYVVQAMLVKRDFEPRLGATVQVLTPPAKANAAQPFWSDSWERSVEAAAYAAAAYILPRTRASNTPPWSTWSGIAIPAQLVQHYVRAERLSAKRRYDEALEHYFAALQLDPSNLDLRLEIGSLQETLSLWLDALETYTSIDATVKAQPARGSHKELQPVVTRAARRRRDRAAYLARYRRAVLLGFGQPLADQWFRTGSVSGNPPSTKRDEERRALRKRLHDDMVDATGGEGWPGAFRAACPDYPDDSSLAFLDEPSRQLPTARVEWTDAEVAAWWWLRRFFQAVSRHESDRLLQDQRKVSRAGTDLTAASLRIALLWSEMRLEATRLAPTSAELAKIEGWDRAGPGVFPLAEWPSPERLECLVEERLGKQLSDRRPSLRRRDPGSAQGWSIRYNAACTYAVALAAETDGDRRTALAERAARQLREAVACTSSTVIASRRDWVVSSDPDLDALRGDPHFRRFETTHLPSAKRSPTRPPNVQRLELARHSLSLLAGTAERLEDRWHSLSPRLSNALDAHTLLAWGVEDRDAWDMVGCAAKEHRHWQTRVELVRAVNGWFPERPLRVPYSDYADDPLPDSDTLEEDAGHARRAAEQMVTALPGVIETIAVAQKPWLDGVLRRDDADERIEASAVRALCARRAALWARLRAVLTTPLDPAHANSRAERLDEFKKAAIAAEPELAT